MVSKPVFLFFLFLFSLSVSSGQNDPAFQPAPGQQPAHKCGSHEQNPLIRISSFTADTILFDRLDTSCYIYLQQNPLLVEGNGEKTVVFFLLEMVLENDPSVLELRTSGNHLSDEMIRTIQKFKPAKILIDEVLTWDGTRQESAGHRLFFIR